MYYIMFESNDGKINVVSNVNFSNYKEALKNASSLVPENTKPIVMRKMGLNFNAFKPNTCSETSVLLYFKNVSLIEHVPCVELGSYSVDENGKVSFAIEYNEFAQEQYDISETNKPINIFKEPSYFAALPLDQEFTQIKSDFSNILYSKPVLIKFSSGAVSSGIFLKEESGNSYFTLWDLFEKYLLEEKYQEQLNTPVGFFLIEDLSLPDGETIK